MMILHSCAKAIYVSRVGSKRFTETIYKERCSIATDGWMDGQCKSGIGIGIGIEIDTPFTGGGWVGEVRCLVVELSWKMGD